MKNDKQSLVTRLHALLDEIPQASEFKKESVLKEIEPRVKEIVEIIIDDFDYDQARKWRLKVDSHFDAMYKAIEFFCDSDACNRGIIDNIKAMEIFH